MMKNIKIGYDAKRAYHNSSGLGNYSRDLIRMVQNALSKGSSIVLFNPKTKSKHTVNLLSCNREVTPTHFFWKKFKGLWRTFKIKDLAKKERIDLYHGLSGEIPRNIHKKVPTIVTIHDLIFMRYPKLYSFFDRKIHFRKFLYAAQNAHHIIAISEQTKNDIIQFLKVPENKITVVYQGCHQVFKNNYTLEEKQKVRDKYNLPSQFVLNVGTIEKRKNALSIVKAIKDIDTQLVLVGRKTNYYNEIEEYAKQHKIQHKIQVLSNVSREDLAIIYQLATVFCYPSVFEGFGIPIIESLFSKTPVITSNGGCFPEAAGPYSLYVNPETAEVDLKTYIIELLSKPNLREQMADQGLSYAYKFIDDIVTNNILTVYKKTLDGQV